MSSALDRARYLRKIMRLKRQKLNGKQPAKPDGAHLALTKRQQQITLLLSQNPAIQALIHKRSLSGHRHWAGIGLYKSIH